MINYKFYMYISFKLAQLWFKKRFQGWQTPIPTGRFSAQVVVGVPRPETRNSVIFTFSLRNRITDNFKKRRHRKKIR